MSMSHKAFAFDWAAFKGDSLRHILLAALATGETGEIAGYIEAHRKHLRDPYEGDRLDADWADMIENGDVHEYGDFALTRFYTPANDGGIAEEWLAIDARLKIADRAALLGKPLGDSGAYFDPGRQGSYFQLPSQVVRSLAKISRFSSQDWSAGERKAIGRFGKLLRGCADAEMGLYVTF